MKAALVLVILCLVLSLGALGLSLFSSGRAVPIEPRDASASTGLPAPSQPASADSTAGEVLARMDEFSREIDDLRAQIAALKVGAAREPVTKAAPEKPLDEPASAFAAQHRDAILKVIEDDRQEQKRKQEEEQRARDMQTALARAERTAKEFGLASAQQKALADVYILEREKLEDLRNQVRDQGGLGGDPVALRQSFREMRDWRLNELTTRLGTDLAEKINAADLERFRGGFGPGGGQRRGNRGQGGSDAGPDARTDAGNRPGGGF